MSLDCYAVKMVDADPKLFESVPNGLHHGLYSRTANGFYGSRYAAFVSAITDATLYDELLSVEQVQHMADALEDWIADHPGESWADPQDISLPGHDAAVPLSPEEITALTQWFRIAADNDCAVMNWF